MALDNILPGQSANKPFVLHFRARCHVAVEVLLQYCTETTTTSGRVKAWQHSKHYEEALSAVCPVRTHFAFETLERAPLASIDDTASAATPPSADTDDASAPTVAGKLVARSEPFLLQWRIASNVAWPIEIVSARLQLGAVGGTDGSTHEAESGGDGSDDGTHVLESGDEVSPGAYPYARSDASFAGIANATLGPHEQLSACACMHLGASLAARVDLGRLHIAVRRLGATRSTTSTHALPVIAVHEPGVSLHAQVAPVGYLRQPMRVTYTLKNHTKTVQDVIFQVCRVMHRVCVV